MATRAERIKVGTFAIAGAAILAVVLAVFGALRLWGGEDIYYVESDQTVMGLEVGAKVTQNGVRVGNVKSLTVPPDDLDKVRIAIEIDDDTPVKADTQAIIRLVGVTGLKIVDLRGGSAGSPDLPPGSKIPLGQSLVDKAQDRASVMLDKSVELMDEATAVLKNLREITDPAQFGDVKRIVERTRVAAEELAKASAALRVTVASVDRAAKSADGLVVDVRGVVRQNADELRGVMSDVRQASRSFRDLARELRQRPSRLVFSSPPKDRRLP